MNIDKMKKRIAAMLAKGEDKAATEAEADAAIAKAQQLMDDYKLTKDDLTLDADKLKFEGREAPYDKTYRHEVDTMLASAIGNYVGCIAYYNNAEKMQVFYGVDSDVDLALFLRSTFKSAMERSFHVYFNYIYVGDKNESVVRPSFMIGFAHNRIETFNLMKNKSGADTGDGRAIAVIKRDLVAEKLAETGVRLGKGKRPKARAVDMGAYNSGRVAGQQTDVGSGRGVGSQARIGR